MKLCVPSKRISISRSNPFALQMRHVPPFCGDNCRTDRQIHLFVRICCCCHHYYCCLFAIHPIYDQKFAQQKSYLQNSQCVSPPSIRFVGTPEYTNFPWFPRRPQSLLLSPVGANKSNIARWQARCCRFRSCGEIEQPQILRPQPNGARLHAVWYWLSLPGILHPWRDVGEHPCMDVNEFS